MIGTSEIKNAGIAKNNIGTPAFAKAMPGTSKAKIANVTLLDLCTILSWYLTLPATAGNFWLLICGSLQKRRQRLKVRLTGLVMSFS